MKYFVTLLLALSLLFGCVAQADSDRSGEMVLSVAISELGYTATAGGYSKYGEWGRKRIRRVVHRVCNLVRQPCRRTLWHIDAGHALPSPEKLRGIRRVV